MTKFCVIKYPIMKIQNLASVTGAGCHIILSIYRYVYNIIYL